jgi:hypothetical protein
LEHDSVPISYFISQRWCRNKQCERCQKKSQLPYLFHKAPFSGAKSLKGD